MNENISDNTESNVNVTAIQIGKGLFSMMQIEEIAEYFKKIEENISDK